MLQTFTGILAVRGGLVLEEIRRYKIGETGYPKRLENIPDPPEELYVIGRLPEEERLSVAIVGARECSEYGRFVARELGGLLGRHGISVISGMARGIDGIGQAAALDGGGSSYGILGCGVDICYPKENRVLYERLKTEGGILSEYVPGTQALAWNFPPRNRIVSGLADVVVVIEARVKSGTLITVDMALEQGKEVYVVPGRVTDRLSDGCNRLLKQGANILLSPKEFMMEIAERANCTDIKENVGGDGGEGMAGKTVQGEKRLRKELKAVFEALDYMPRSVEEIGSRLPEGHGNGLLVTYLMELCVEGMAVQVSPGSFVRSSRL